MRKSKFIITVAIITAVLFSVGTITAFSENTGKKVILGGTPFGLKLFTNGVIVIEVDDSNSSPAKSAGIKINDIIIAADNRKIESNEQLKEVIENSNGKSVKLTISRGSDNIEADLTPKKNDQNSYIAGMWIRDSTAGIGTVTYFDDEKHIFGALGHGICDKDTGMLMPLKNGEIMSATISSCQKAADGCVGGLNGYFNSDKIGNIMINNDYGIYGQYQTEPNSRMIEIADVDEITTGDAKIVTTIDSTGPKEYDVCIDTLNTNRNTGQNMVITVKDEELLEKTGGIIQGMSGSPIIQNGKLVGAVTHVFVNSPKKGYGICITNMLSNHENEQ